MALFDTTKKVIIEVLMDDKASGQLTQLSGKTQGTTQAMGKNFLAMAAKVTAISTALVLVAKGIDKVAQRSGDIKRLSKDFDTLTDSVGSNSVVAIEKMRIATRGLMSDYDLMKTSNKILLQGLAQTDDQMAEIVKVADRLGDQTISTTQRVDDFTQLLKNQSIFLLDNFGISVGKVRDRIEELQTQFPEMTRDVAFNTAVMEESRGKMELLGDFAETSSDDLNRLKVSFQNLKDELTIAVTPALDTLINGLINLIGWFEEGWGWMKEKLEPAFRDLDEAIEELAVQAGIFFEEMGIDTEDITAMLKLLAAVNFGPLLAVLYTLTKLLEGIVWLASKALEKFNSLANTSRGFSGGGGGSWGGDNQQSGGVSGGGLTLVGEAGPELVRLPMGSHVTGAGETRESLSGGGVTINVNAPTYGVDNFKETIISAVNQATAKQNRLANYNLL